MTTHHFVAASARFLTEEEPLEEVLKERRRHYGEQGKEIDFWLVLLHILVLRMTTKATEQQSNNTLRQSDKQYMSVSTVLRTGRAQVCPSS